MTGLHKVRNLQMFGWATKIHILVKDAYTQKIMVVPVTKVWLFFLQPQQPVVVLTVAI